MEMESQHVLLPEYALTRKALRTERELTGARCGPITEIQRQRLDTDHRPGEYRRINDDEALSVEISTDEDSKAPQSRAKIGATGSRVGLITWICLSVTVLCINLISMIVAVAQYSVQSGAFTLYSGSCDTVKNWANGLHVLINILSSLLLSASNYTMQILCAPSRQELDKAHATGDWLDIGVLSVRNHFRRIQPRRTRLFIALAISSLPLHLLYNSAVFKSTSAIDYIAAIVQPDFADDADALASINLLSNVYNDLGFHNSTTAMAAQLAPVLNFFSRSATDPASVANLTSAECRDNYHVQIINQRSDLLLISTCPQAFPASNTSEDSTTVAIWNPQGAQEQYAWMCRSSEVGQPSNCVAGQPSSCATGQPSSCAAGGLPKSVGGDWVVQGCKIEFCLSRLEEISCKLKASLYILLAVILCNIVKIFVMIWTLLYYSIGSIITIGDAIASYLNVPDSHSAGNCLATKVDVETHQLTARPMGFRLDGQQPWISAVSVRRRCVTFGLCCLTILFAVILLYIGIEHSSIGTLTNPFGRGFGQLDEEELLTVFSQPLSFVATVLITNTPQLIVSFLYITYNGLVTTMLLAAEFNKYYLRPKTLRVTNPLGFQRSTYWLQLPYKYSVPLTVAMVTLHWLISESLLTAEVDVQYSGACEAAKASLDQTGFGSRIGPTPVIGYSVLPMLLAIIMGSCMVVALAALGWFRKLHNPIPLVSSCSLAIAAACHPPEEDLDAAHRPVSWGAIEVETEGPDGEVGHCCFTSHSVGAPMPGKLYAGLPTRKRVRTRSDGEKSSGPKQQL